MRAAATAALSYPVAAGLVLLYGLFVWLDSSSLTAGTVGSAVPEARGSTLAVHSTLGYAGSAVGLLMVGWILDLAGGQSVFGWSVAFAHVALVMDEVVSHTAKYYWSTLWPIFK